MKHVEVLPDWVEAQQFRLLCERLVSALELHFSPSVPEQALICEARAKLQTSPPDYYAEEAC